MLKLPVCPHCGAVYSYKEISGMKNSERISCYHCKKMFSVKKRAGRAVLLSVVCLILSAANIAVMVSSENFLPVLMMAADAVVITAAVLMLPLTAKFKAEKLTKSEKRNRK